MNLPSQNRFIFELSEGRKKLILGNNYIAGKNLKKARKYGFRG
jgi:hypothetical protein